MNTLAHLFKKPVGTTVGIAVGIAFLVIFSTFHNVEISDFVFFENMDWSGSK